MEVDRTNRTMEEPLANTKRRRFRTPAPEPGILPHLGNGATLESFCAPIPALTEQVLKEFHACQSFVEVEGVEDGHNNSVKPLPLGGVSESFSGSILNFQRPLEGISSSAGLGPSLGRKPNPAHSRPQTGDKPKTKKQGKKVFSVKYTNYRSS